MRLLQNAPPMYENLPLPKVAWTRYFSKRNYGWVKSKCFSHRKEILDGKKRIACYISNFARCFSTHYLDRCPTRPVVMHETRPQSAPITESAAGETEELGRSFTHVPALSYLRVLQGVWKAWLSRAFRELFLHGTHTLVSQWVVDCH